MEFKRILQYLLLTLIPIYLVTGCGDLEPEMQDTRTVILKMDFDQRSSSRSNSRSPSELIQYNTHLILAVPFSEFLTDNYSNIYRKFDQGLVNTGDNTVSLKIPFDTTQIKIFAFLFRDTYSLDKLKSEYQEVGNYGESQSFSISETQSISVDLKVPEDLTATGGASQVVLDWTAVSGATSYTVYWGSATGVSSSSTSITSVSTEGYTHTGLYDGTTYYYKVAAVDSAGTGMLSSEDNATTFTAITTTTLTTGGSMDPSLEAFYPFNGNANDLTSNGRNLAVYDNTTLIAGKDNSSNSAYSFDGDGDYLEYTTDIPSFDNYTISLWAKPASTGTYEAMFSSYDDSSYGFQIDLDGGNFHIRKSGGGNIVLSTARLEVWTFIAFTYDGTNSIGYINDNITVSAPGGTTEFNRFRIGRNRNGNTYFTGAIDELKIYNRALTASEISSLYAN